MAISLTLCAVAYVPIAAQGELLLHRRQDDEQSILVALNLGSEQVSVLSDSIGLGGEILVLSSIYLVMPVGRLSVRHALIGGIVATVLWELTRHGLAWYYATVSQIQVVYGTFATSVGVLLSAELGALVLLVGAQVIAEYERTQS